tara:strand:+ start:1079 stop:2791 length:1713 start_codon:yes stop_codon:yes gene_type:complete
MDSICINQADVVEKSYQISLMGAIYSQAAKVIVFLGDPRPENGEDADEIATLDLEEVLKSMRGMNSGGENSHLQFGRGLPVTLIKSQVKICAVLTHDWWTRLWTMQEYVLAAIPVFLFGTTVIEDAALREYVDHYERLNLAELESLMSPNHWRVIKMVHNKDLDPMHFHEIDARGALPSLQLLKANLCRGSSDQSELIKADVQVLTSTFYRNATVAADKILGLTGLLQQFRAAVPKVPVTSHKEVFRSIARSLLTNTVGTENLALLHYVDTCEQLDDTPSWVPNFHSRLRISVLSPYNQSESFLYKSSDKTAIVQQLPTSEIRLLGFVIDRVEKCVDKDTFTWNYSTPPGMHYSCAAQLEFELACRNLSADVADRNASNREALEQAVLRYHCTLVAGSRLKGTSYVLWEPSMKTYRAWMRRMETLAGYEGFDWLNNSRNPHVSIDKSRFTGQRGRDLAKGEGLDGLAAHETGGEPEEFHQRFYEVCKGRTFFSTVKGGLGLGPSRTKRGDFVVIFHGGRTPFVIRKSQSSCPDGQTYRIVGEAYVHGFMDGEVYNAAAFNRPRERWFEIA